MTRDPRYPHLPPREAFIGTKTSTPAESYFSTLCHELCHRTSHESRKRKEIWNAKTKPEGRWRKFSYEELKARDRTSLDVFWLRDKSLTDLDNLPEPDELAEEIIENLEAGLNSFREVLAGLNKVA
jgi:type I restriction enzyme M protein